MQIIEVGGNEKGMFALVDDGKRTIISVSHNSDFLGRLKSRMEKKEAALARSKEPLAAPLAKLSPFFANRIAPSRGAL